jgi:hypothetical protein
VVVAAVAVVAAASPVVAVLDLPNLQASLASPQQGAGVATQHNEQGRGGQMTPRLFHRRVTRICEMLPFRLPDGFVDRPNTAFGLCGRSDQLYLLERPVRQVSDGA